MAVYTFLMCPSRRLMIGLGKRIRNADHVVVRLAWGSPPDWLPEALFTVLDDCAGEDLELVLDSEEVFDEVTGTWTDIDEDDADDNVVTFETYLAGRTVPPTTYYAQVHPDRPPSEAAEVMRQRGTAPDVVDEAFTSALHWEPTDFLRRAELGPGPTEHIEITARQAMYYVTRVLVQRLRPDI